MGLHDVLERCKVWIGEPENMRDVRHRYRVFPQFPNVSAVYCDTKLNVAKLVYSFWTPTTTEKQIELAASVYDLVAAVLGPLGKDKDPSAVKRLDEKFVRPSMSRWMMLWPKQYAKQRFGIRTHIDVDHDPIIPALRQWMSDTDNQQPAPTYPALGVPDLRPTEVIPEALQAMDPDVWPSLQCVGLERLCKNMMWAYHRSAGQPIAAAEQPHDERLRQFRRIITTDGDELSCREITELFGWECAKDTFLLKTITEVLMSKAQRSGGPVPTSMWYNTERGGVALWRYALCLREMRVAIIFVTRLRLGGADISFLARNIATCLPVGTKCVS